MAGGIWSALGAALQQGVATHNTLGEQEQERKRQEQLMRLQQEEAARSAEQFNLSKQDRERANIQQALDWLNPGDTVNTDLLSRIRERTPELLSRININPGRPELNVTEGMPTPDAPTGPATTMLPEQATRKATLSEQSFLDKRSQDVAERQRQDAWRQRLASPEFAALSFDDQVREAAAHGQNLPLSSKEWERRSGIEHGNRMQLQHAQNAGRLGALPNTEALVQSIASGNVNFHSLPKPLQTRLMPLLAQVGFTDFTSPEQRGKRETALAATNETLRVVDQLIDEAGNLRPGVDNLFGFTSGSRWLPGSNASNAEASLNQLVSKDIVNLIAEMKAQSRTGATGFGALNLKELEVLQNAANKLSNRWQSDESAREELLHIRNKLQLALQDGQALEGQPIAFDPSGGARPTAPQGAQPSQTGQDTQALRLKWGY